MIDLSQLMYFRKSLRITSTDFDDEIEDIVFQGIADLESSGVDIQESVFVDPYLMSILTLYLKANFGLENTDADWYAEQYSKKKAELLNKAKYIRGD